MKITTDNEFAILFCEDRIRMIYKKESGLLLLYDDWNDTQRHMKYGKFFIESCTPCDFKVIQNIFEMTMETSIGVGNGNGKYIVKVLKAPEKRRHELDENTDTI